MNDVLRAITRIYLCSDIFLAKYRVVKCCLDNMHYNGLRNTKQITGKNTVILKYIFLVLYCWLYKYKTSYVHLIWKNLIIFWTETALMILWVLTDLLSPITLSNKTKSFLYQFRSFGGSDPFFTSFWRIWIRLWSLSTLM